MHKNHVILLSFILTLTMGVNVQSEGFHFGVISAVKENVEDLKEQKEKDALISVSITSPAKDAILSGIVSITADASDKISKVEFYINNELKTTDITAPYSYSWDTTIYPGGTYTIAVKAYTVDNNVATDLRTVALTNNAPGVTITVPADASTVSGTVEVTAAVTDDIGITKVEFYIDNILKSTNTTSPYTFFWNTGVHSLTQHTVKVIAYDTANQTASVQHTVTVSRQAAVQVVKSADGWRLLVEGKPYIIKGMGYHPIKVGESPDNQTERDWMIVDDDNNGKIDAPYQSWVDQNKNNQQDANETVVGDFQLLKDMGCNTIRMIHHTSGDPEIIGFYGQSSPFSHAPNKELLRDLFNTYGIRVIVADLIGAYTIGTGADWNTGTDYRDPEQRRRIKLIVQDMVKEFKDEPFTLLYVLGNENNNESVTHTNASQYPDVYASFLNELAQMIHKMDPNHPVALCAFDATLITEYEKYAPDIDIFGTNAYRGSNFGDLWQTVHDKYDKPVMFVEFGADRFNFVNNDIDEDEGSELRVGCWQDIEANTAGHGYENAIGGCFHEWLDRWWLNGNPYAHDKVASGEYPQEYFGFASQGDGSKSPFLRQLRKSYSTIKDLWTK